MIASAECKSARSFGDKAMAQRKSEKARRLMNASAIVGGLFWIATAGLAVYGVLGYVALTKLSA